jgi:tRNA pseudouridine13 synthase
MYIHAYQSYVWNAIVSERIRNFGTRKPVAGDLVILSADKDQITLDEEVPAADAGGADDNVATSKKSRKPYQPPKVVTLTESNVNNYNIFDVVMPLPGTDVAYPGGELGERYRNFLRMDGLDPDNFVRKQR